MKLSTDDAHQEAQALAREIRACVADQFHDLVVEREGLGSLDEVLNRVRSILDAHKQMLEALGRQRQADEHGLPKAKHVQAEREARELLRATLLSCAEACGSVVVGLDFELRKREG